MGLIADARTRTREGEGRMKGGGPEFGFLLTSARKNTEGSGFQSAKKWDAWLPWLARSLSFRQVFRKFPSEFPAFAIHGVSPTIGRAIPKISPRSPAGGEKDACDRQGETTGGAARLPPTIGDKIPWHLGRK